MSDPAFFVEVFPILTEDIPPLFAYALQVSDDDEMNAMTLGGKLAYRLNNTYPGRWVWADYRILTDTPISPIQLEISVDIFRQEIPELYASLKSIEEDPRWQFTPHGQAEYVMKTKIRHREFQIRNALERMRVQVSNAFVMREPVFQTWVVDGHPALSISVRSHLRHDRNLQNFMHTHAKPEDVLGLRVIDKTAQTMEGTITAVTGTLVDHREKLLTFTRREVMQKILRDAPDDEWVVLVDAGNYQYEYTASALHILLNVNDYDEMARFAVNRQQVLKAMRLSPDHRASLVKTVSDSLKTDGIIDNAFNSRINPQLFAQIDFMPNLTYASSRVYPYTAQNLGTDFLRGGLFKMHPRFTDAPISLAIINTLDDVASDFVEAMRRQLERDFGFTIELIRERRVRVLNTKNLESAVRVVENENPHLLLAFFQSTQEDAGDDANASYLKSLALGKGIASHVVYEQTVHNPDAMASVIMAVLAKTGNIPFVLAEPLEYADYVIGLNIIRHKMTRGDRIAALARIYKSNGELVRYTIEKLELETNEPLPYVVWQTLLPMQEFEGKRIIIHHDGKLDTYIARMLKRWGDAMQASIYPVEIMRYGIPRIYQLDASISAPSWGTAFLLNSDEAFVVASDVAESQTPKPLYIRSIHSDMPIELASYSVLAWTLLHYGALGTHKLPVTIQYDDEMRQWLARGILPTQKEGDVPFWL